MTDPVSPQDQPARQDSIASDVARSVPAFAAFVGGFLIGVSGPLGACSVGAGLACGLTLSGLLLVAGLAATVVSGLTALFLRRGLWVFAAAGALTVGLVAGNLAAPALGLGPQKAAPSTSPIAQGWST